ncbi:hypothetical protein QEJ31_01085 [Pigmentibacter sp. JX0631]|uniref:hypothetical protein n=1 Tax=Pigmentibacter sp. JX0631 TaxID=2976982 RepID=UPI002469BDB3|nr:hypothetical protein [Pigmentibacter sp. JX0631]WGL60197.1 hypothetical protein QEJ31_01085 [Pigmentibacter sp. JX0631]
MIDINWEVSNKNLNKEKLNFFSFKSNISKKIYLCLVISFIQIIFLHCLNDNKLVSNTEFKIIKTKGKINFGEPLTEDNIVVSSEKIEDISNFIQKNNNLNFFLGKKTAIDLDENNYIFNANIQTKDKNSIPEKIPYGKRLFVLELELGAIAKSLRTGDKVDIIANLDIPGFGKATEVILQNIQLIGLEEKNKYYRSRYNSSNSISFYLTPEEIKIILFMKRYANFSLALRNPNDNFDSKDQAVTLNKFIENEKIKNIIKNDRFQIIYGDKK